MGYQNRTIIEMLKGINHIYYLPSIQRKFVWDVEQIENLFDSLMRNYPIGTFLFWSIEKGGDPSHIDEYTFYKFISDYSEKDSLEFMQEKLNKPSLKDTLVAVLDGQQRLSSLYCALCGSYAYKTSKRLSPNNPYPKRELYYNLLYKSKTEMDNKHEFKFLIDSEATVKDSEHYWLKVKDLIAWSDNADGRSVVKRNLRAITRGIKECGLTQLDDEAFDEIESEAEVLWDVIINQQLITFYEIKKESLDDILDIFVRVNSAGTPLSKSDLVFSTIVANWENGREKIEELLEILNSKGNKFKFDKDFIITLCLALLDLPQKFQVKTFTRENVKKVETEWESISNAIIDGVDLLVEFGFNYENFTATYIIIPVAYYLFKSGKRYAVLKEEDKSTIRKFLISGMAKKIFSASVENGLSNILSKLKVCVDDEKKIYELACADHFDFESLKSLEFQGKTLRVDLADIEELLEQKKGALTFMLLSLLYPDLKLGEIDWHQDHIHPKTCFDKKKLKTYFEEKGLVIEETKLEEWRRKADTLVNLQLLKGKINQEKGKTALSQWVANQYATENKLERYCEDNYIDLSAGFALENFDTYYQKRREKIREKLIEIFDVVVQSEEDVRRMEEEQTEAEVAMTEESITIAKAAKSVLENYPSGLTVEQIYESIMERSLYTFHAAEPVVVLRIEIRRRCEGVEISKAYEEKWFKVVREEDGKPCYALLEKN